MPALSDIPGIGRSSLELLDTAGIRDAGHLAGQDVEDLTFELTRANEVLGIVKRAPGKTTVAKWIASAAELIASLPPDPRSEQATFVNHETNPEVLEMLDLAPLAIPLPGKMLMEKGLGVSDVPPGLLLNQYPGDLEHRAGSPDPCAPKQEMPARRNSGAVERVAGTGERRQFESSGAKAIPAPSGKGRRVPRSKPDHEMNRVALIRGPLEKTNRGKDPNSRRYVRGVLHTHPWVLRIGAIFSLLLFLILPLAVVSAFLLMVSQEIPGTFHWVPKWILAFPIALPVVGLGYMIWGFRGNCRVCTQKLFVHKGALKHMKAHRLPGLGYVIPLCIYLLLFNWFRCSSCGTPIRLKK